MTITNFPDLIPTLKKPDALKILFYLYEFNPNVSVSGLVSNFGIKESDVMEHLNVFEKSNVIEKTNNLYRLTFDGREMVRGFYHDIGQTPPEPKTETPV